MSWFSALGLRLPSFSMKEMLLLAPQLCVVSGSPPALKATCLPTELFHSVAAWPLGTCRPEGHPPGFVSHQIGVITLELGSSRTGPGSTVQI